MPLRSSIQSSTLSLSSLLLYSRLLTGIIVAHMLLTNLLLYIHVGSENGFQSINQQKECTKIESSRVLFKELEEVGSWEHLCHNLGVSTATVNSLNLDHAQNTEKKRRCLEAFYKDKEPRVQVCWETVVKAVSSYPISNRKLAKRIASKYNINIAIIDP